MMIPGQDNKDIVSILKKSLLFGTLVERTYLVVLAVHKDPTKNFISGISYQSGEPIGGYVADVINQEYCIDCYASLSLGYIPFALYLNMKNVDNWKVRLPIPENLIQKVLTDEQKKELSKFKKVYRSSDFMIQYRQFTSNY